MHSLGLWVFGLYIGIVIGTQVVENTNTAIQSYNASKYQCEQNIPRNQTCDVKFVAVPRVVDK